MDKNLKEVTIWNKGVLYTGGLLSDMFVTNKHYVRSIHNKIEQSLKSQYKCVSGLPPNHLMVPHFVTTTTSALVEVP